MSFKSDRQRKAVMAKLRSGSSMQTLPKGFKFTKTKPEGFVVKTFGKEKDKVIRNIQKSKKFKNLKPVEKSKAGRILEEIRKAESKKELIRAFKKNKRELLRIGLGGAVLASLVSFVFFPAAVILSAGTGVIVGKKFVRSIDTPRARKRMKERFIEKFKDQGFSNEEALKKAKRTVFKRRKILRKLTLIK